MLRDDVLLLAQACVYQIQRGASILTRHARVVAAARHVAQSRMAARTRVTAIVERLLGSVRHEVAAHLGARGVLSRAIRPSAAALRRQTILRWVVLVEIARRIFEVAEAGRRVCA